MRKTLGWALVVSTAFLLGASPVAAQHRARARATAVPRISSTAGVRVPAQSRRPGVRVRARFGPGLSNFQRHIFVPGFGLRPVIQERFPVFGLGFDAHHFHVLHRHRGFVPFHPGFIGAGFFGGNFFGAGFFPFPVISSSSSVVVIPQAVPVEVPVFAQEPRPRENAVVVAPGLPEDWPRLRIARSSFPRQQVPLAQLTLLVLKDHTIFAVTAYWLEDGRIFYVTSTGRQDSVALRDLDWEMTTQLNADRGVEFVLQSRP